MAENDISLFGYLSAKRKRNQIDGGQRKASVGKGIESERLEIKAYQHGARWPFAHDAVTRRTARGSMATQSIESESVKAAENRKKKKMAKISAASEIMAWR